MLQAGLLKILKETPGCQAPLDAPYRWPALGMPGALQALEAWATPGEVVACAPLAAGPLVTSTYAASAGSAHGGGCVKARQTCNGPSGALGKQVVSLPSTSTQTVRVSISA